MLRQKFLYIIGSNLIISQSCAPLALADSPLLKRGITAYNTGNFDRANEYLNKSRTSDFDNPMLHYYLGNTLMRLNKTSEALTEYNIAYTLNPKGQIANYCQSILARYKKGGNCTNKSEPIIDGHLSRSFSDINKQAQSSKLSQINRSKLYAEEHLKRSNSQVKAQRAINDALERGTHLENSASNLELLMITPKRAGDVQLNAQGTNLFIRNYAAGDSAPNKTKLKNSHPSELEKLLKAIHEEERSLSLEVQDLRLEEVSLPKKDDESAGAIEKIKAYNKHLQEYKDHLQEYQYKLQLMHANYKDYQLPIFQYKNGLASHLQSNLHSSNENRNLAIEQGIMTQKEKLLKIHETGRQNIERHIIQNHK